MYISLKTDDLYSQKYFEYMMSQDVFSSVLVPQEGKHPDQCNFVLTQNKKLKKKRKYRIQGLMKENVSARFRFWFLSIVCWYFDSPTYTVDLQWVELRSLIYPQPPRESVWVVVICRLWGVSGWLWRFSVMPAGPRTVYVGWWVRLQKYIQYLVDWSRVDPGANPVLLSAPLLLFLFLLLVQVGSV